MSCFVVMNVYVFVCLTRVCYQRPVIFNYYDPVCRFSFTPPIAREGLDSDDEYGWVFPE